MVKKVYAVMDTACEAASKATGVPIRFPKPGKRAWKVSAALNCSIGIGFLVFGFISPYKWVLSLGALGIVGGIINYRQSLLGRP